MTPSSPQGKPAVRRIACRALVLAIAALAGCAPPAPQQPLEVEVRLDERRVGDRTAAFPVLLVANAEARDLWVGGLRHELHEGITCSVIERATRTPLLAGAPIAKSIGGKGRFAEQGGTLLAAGSRIGVCIWLFLAPDRRYNTILHVNKTFLLWPNAPDGPARKLRQTNERDFAFPGYVPTNPALRPPALPPR